MGSDEYRARAAELRLQAERAKDAKVREQFLLMALDWEKLAESAVVPAASAADTLDERRARELVADRRR